VKRGLNAKNEVGILKRMTELHFMYKRKPRNSDSNAELQIFCNYKCVMANRMHILRNII
jgi:hypothetical protein